MRNRLIATVLALLVASACKVGPNYHVPTAPAPAAYKEPVLAGWKEAQPNDAALRGKWWEIFGDPQLNALEEQVSLGNQNLVAAEAQFRAARDAVRLARSSLFPTLTAGAGVTNSRTSATLTNNQFATFTPGLRTLYNMPLSLSYQADVLGQHSPRHHRRRGECAGKRRATRECATVLPGRIGDQLLRAANDRYPA